MIMKLFKPKQQTISDELAAMQAETDDPILPTVKAEVRKTKHQTVATWATIGTLAAGVVAHALGGNGESGKQPAQQEGSPTPPVYSEPSKGAEPAPSAHGTEYQPVVPTSAPLKGAEPVAPDTPDNSTHRNEFQPAVPMSTPAPALPPTPAPPTPVMPAHGN